MNALTTLAAGLDPAVLFAEALGTTPDPWQKKVLRSVAARQLLLCCRQAGKSTVSSLLALHTTLYRPDALVLLLSPSLRQSGELFKKTVGAYRVLGRPVGAEQETALTLTLANGSRVVSLPGKDATVRGFSGVTLLVIDEASRVPDDLYYAVRPMLAVSGGRLVALSTPYGQRGWFYEAWAGPESWERVRITANRCPRIGADFLAEEERALGPRYFRQEYLTSFEDVVDAVFAHEDIQAAVAAEVKPLVLG